MNSPRQMLVVYLQLRTDMRFGLYCGEDHYRLLTMNEMLRLTSDEEGMLNEVLGQATSEKGANEAIAAFEAQIGSDQMSASEIMGRLAEMRETAHHLP